jgi:hypothetical protein
MARERNGFGRWLIGAALVGAAAIYARGCMEERSIAEAREISAKLDAQLKEQAKAAAAAREAAKPPEQRERERLEEERRQAKRAEEDAKRREFLAAAAKLRPSVNALQWYEACIEWGRLARNTAHTPRREALLQRLLELDAINAHDLAHVTDRLPKVGMTACGVYAQMGMPDDINTTDTAHRKRQQLVYREPRRYVYLESAPDNANGLVTSLQH